MPAFCGLSLEEIVVPASVTACRQAVREILEASICGFDTESKPTFRAGQKSTGPHLVQFAISDKAFLFQLHRRECEEASAELMAAPALLKVGFGLQNDRSQICNRFGIVLSPVVDLDQIFRKLGYRGQIGVRGAIGALLKQGFKKSKRITTSNWAKHELTPSQILYAANDAYAALAVMETLRAEGLID